MYQGACLLMAGHARCAAGHAGLSVGLHNAGYLFAEEMPQLRRKDVSAFKQAAVRYLQVHFVCPLGVFKVW